jgi:hypothetical protein
MMMYHRGIWNVKFYHLCGVSKLYCTDDGNQAPDDVDVMNTGVDDGGSSS